MNDLGIVVPLNGSRFDAAHRTWLSDFWIGFSKLPAEHFACNHNSMLKMTFSGVLLDVNVAERLACPKNRS